MSILKPKIATSDLEANRTISSKTRASLRATIGALLAFRLQAPTQSASDSLAPGDKTVPHEVAAELPSLTYKSFYKQIRFNETDLKKVPEQYEVSAAIQPLDGYHLMYVPDEAMLQPLLSPKDQPSREYKEKYPNTFSAKYGCAKAVVAIVQTVYSCVSLYRARADQISQYGYAAFGLTVAPYAVMSVVNFIGNLCTPDYAALHLLHSDDLEEARRRGISIDGAVGKLRGMTIDPTTWTGTFEGDLPPPRPSGDEGEDTEVYTMKFQKGRETLRARVYIDKKAKDDKGLLAQTSLRHAQRRSPMKHKFARFCLAALVVLAPLIINGAISEFSSGSKSTSAQRGWTMSWLLVAITSCVFIVPGSVSSYLRGEDHLRNPWKTAFVVLFSLACGVPASGGLITVVKMLLEFGSCARFD